ncbi:MAG: hypothetical protein M1832_006064, partial [Thelocarpon impressellum]
MSSLGLVAVYLLGGLTLPPLLIALVLIHAFLTFPVRPDAREDIARPGDDDVSLPKSGDTTPPAGDVAAGYFAVCREYVPGGVNGKPPERTTPAGQVVAAESPSVYQSMYRSIFDRSRAPTLDVARGARRARNVFFVVLRHGHLMLYDDAEQLEVRHVVSLAHHDVSICAGEGASPIPEGELWIRRNAIRLARRAAPHDPSDAAPSRPFFLFCDNCSDKEDFYFALLQNQERRADRGGPPAPLRHEVRHAVGLVQRLHSSEEHLQTRWLNGLVGRLFLALYKTADVEALVRARITNKIARVKTPAFLRDVVPHRIDMGDGAPHLTNPRLRDLTVDGECGVEADLRYAGNFRIELAATARIELGSRFKAREVDLLLAVVVRRVEGRLLLRVKPPPSNRVWVAFESMPRIDMSIEPIVSSRQITYAVILRAIESRIREVVAETLVLPHWDDVPFTDTHAQHFRGGIWADDTTMDGESLETASAIVADGAADAVQEGARGADVYSSKESTLSMPTLSAAPASPRSRRPGAASRARRESDAGASSAIESRAGADVVSVDLPAQDVAEAERVTPERPKPVRVGSFTSMARPVVGTDTTTVDAVKEVAGRRERRDSSDATMSMMALSARSPSQPASPAETPPAEAPARAMAIPRPAFPEQDPGGGSHSSCSPSPPTSLVGSAAPMRSTRSSDGVGAEPGPALSWRSTGRDGRPVADRRQSMAAINSATAAATAAAKKWGIGGWGVLARNAERRGRARADGADDGGDDGAREGTPENL